MDKIAALKRTALFGGLDERALHALAARAVERRLARGEVLFLAGEAARGLYVIVEGSVRAFREGVDGREQVIHVERAGATVAEVPVFDDGPFPATAARSRRPRTFRPTGARPPRPGCRRGRKPPRAGASRRSSSQSAGARRRAWRSAVPARARVRSGSCRGSSFKSPPLHAHDFKTAHDAPAMT